MIEAIYKHLSDMHFVVALLISISVMATILTVVSPLLETDSLSKRMKSVATERERIRARERERFALKDQKGSLRMEPKPYMKEVVENLGLSKWLGTEHAKAQLALAGFRGPQAEVGFLFFRLVTPIALFAVTIFYMMFLADPDMSFWLKLGIFIASLYLGVKLPEIFLTNTTSKRQSSMRRAFPDAMDLILICVESGMAIEPSFRKVSIEIGMQSEPLAEELALATAELSYLPDRRSAYENLALRTGVESIKQISMVLIQAEKYGTPLGQALRVVSQESRDTRLMDAEKKAAALPPKLTVPMIVFFLPVLVACIIGPAIIQICSLP